MEGNAVSNAIIKYADSDELVIGFAFAGYK